MLENLGTAIDNSLNTNSIKDAINSQAEVYNDLTKKLAEYQTEVQSQLKDVILPSIEIEFSNRNLPTDDNKAEYVDTYKTNWKLYGLDELKNKLADYKTVIEICEKNGYNVPYTDESSHTKETHEKMYEKYIDAKNQLDESYIGSCQEAYTKRQKEIDAATKVRDEYDKSRKSAAKEIDKECWIHSQNGKTYSFTNEDLRDLSQLYYDGDYENTNMFLTRYRL